MLATALLARLLALFAPAILASISRKPAAARARRRLGIIYALAIATFGGTAQFMRHLADRCPPARRWRRPGTCRRRW